MPWIDRERRQDGEDLCFEKCPDRVRLARRKVPHLHELNAMGGQRRPQLVAQRTAATFEQRAHAHVNRLQLFRGSKRVRLILRCARRDFAPQSGDAHHIELVEIRTEDREELQALEQRDTLVQCFFKDTRVEVEPTELAIEIGQRDRRQNGLSGGRR